MNSFSLFLCCLSLQYLTNWCESTACCTPTVVIIRIKRRSYQPENLFPWLSLNISSILSSSRLINNTSDLYSGSKWALCSSPTKGKRNEYLSQNLPSQSLFHLYSFITKVKQSESGPSSTSWPRLGHLRKSWPSGDDQPKLEEMANERQFLQWFWRAGQDEYSSSDAKQLSEVLRTKTKSSHSSKEICASHS